MAAANLTDTHGEAHVAVTAAPAPRFPPGRYGRRRDPDRGRQRWIIYVLAAVVVAAGVLIATKLFNQYAQAPYQVRVITVTDHTDAAVTVTFEVRRPAGHAASCTVLAHTRDGEEVGRALVTVPADGPELTQVTFTLATTKRAVTGEVPGCGPADP